MLKAGTQLSFCILVAVVLVSCAKNPVLGYLENAEVQFEGEPQRQNLLLALNDALKLSGKELVARRYRDYGGHEGQWDLRTVMERHFMPDRRGKTLGGGFYKDVKARAVQMRIGQILDELERVPGV